MKIKTSIATITVMAMLSISVLTITFVNVFATSSNSDVITCQSHQGTTMGGIFHMAGNCQGENGVAVYGGGFNTGSTACEGHAVKGPSNNMHFRGGCLDN